MAGRELFVWYRVRRERASEARRVVAEMQRSLVEHWPALQARLLVRDEDPVATWMESYARGPTAAAAIGVDADLEAAIAAAAIALAGVIDGERHVEAFEAAT